MGTVQWNGRYWSRRASREKGTASRKSFILIKKEDIKRFAVVCGEKFKSLDVLNIDGAEKIMKEIAEDTLVRWKSWSGGKWIRIYDATVDKLIKNRREIDRKSRNIKE